MMFPGHLLAMEVSQAPFQVQQRNPAMMRFLDPQPSAAQTLSEDTFGWSLNQSHTSVFLADQLPNPQSYLADMELYVADAGYRRGLGRATEVGIHVPMLRPMAGALDGFLHNYHRALGLPNGGRELRPNNQFAYALNTPNGWQGRSHWELGNVRLNIKHELPDIAEGFQFSAEALVQLPTASQRRGWSHGGVDAGLGLLASWQGDVAFAHVGSWWVHPFKRQDAGYPIRDYARASVTAGYRVQWFDLPLNLMLQVQGGGSPYRTGIPALDTSPWLISFGFRTASDAGLQWSLAFVENITQQSTQDFGINVGVSY